MEYVEVQSKSLIDIEQLKDCNHDLMQARWTGGGDKKCYKKASIPTSISTALTHVCVYTIYIISIIITIWMVTLLPFPAGIAGDSDRKFGHAPILSYPATMLK